MKKPTLLAILLIISQLGAMAASPYHTEAVRKPHGPAYIAEVMTPARNIREYNAAADSSLAKKTTVSILVIPKNKFIGPGEKNPNIQEIHFCDAKARFVCQPEARLQGESTDEFYTKFSATKLKNFKRFGDHRKAMIFEFNRDCFRDATEMRFYSELKDPITREYRYSSTQISDALKEAIVKDFTVTGG